MLIFRISNFIIAASGIVIVPKQLFSTPVESGRSPKSSLKEKRGYWKMKEEAQIALYGDLALEEAIDLS